MTQDITKAVSAVYDHHSRAIQGRAESAGLDESWAAPVGLFDAHNGFAEELWLDSIPVTILSARVKGAPVQWCSGKYAGRVSGPSTTVLMPKGTPNNSRADRDIRFAHIYLRDSLIDRVADGLRPGAQASGTLRDDLVFVPDHELDRRLATYVSRTTSGASSLELEAEAILLVAYLLRTQHGFAGSTRQPRGGLAPWQLHRAIDAMQAHLERDIKLEMLAGVAGCSPTHFSRAFKQSMGVPPFQWLLERRIEKAKMMLATSKMSLAEVALATGFAAQPQFTTAFRRVTGHTPGAWRRDRIF